MEFLKKLWAWLLSQTTLDEQIEAKVAEIKEEMQDVVEATKVVTKEVKDVVKTVKPKRGRKPKAQ
jgi:endonuclease III